MKKYIITAIIFAFSFALMVIPVKAAEVQGEVSETEDTDVFGYSTDFGYEDPGFDIYNYSGEIDLFTGLPVNYGEEGETEEYYNISDGSNYSSSRNMYSYPIGEGTFDCSVADGMVVTGAVQMSLTEASNVDVYRDGNKLDGFPESVSDIGAYTIIYWTDNSSQQVMNFRIVNKVTGVLEQFTLPSGFAFTDVLKDGEKISTGLNSVDLSQEGDYSIGYMCMDNMQQYTLNVTVDHTPPAVEFVGIDENNKAKGPVTVTGIEESDRVYVYYNGEESHLNYNGQLTESGKYRVVVIDTAGNMIEKNFTILIYLNVKSFIFLGILLIGIIALGVALYISRKKLRVR